MKRFKFSMQSILNVRNTMEEVSRMELAKARHALMLEQDKLNSIEKTISAAMQVAKETDTCSCFYFLQREKYIRKLKIEKKDQLFMVQQSTAEVESSIQRLKEAIIEQKKMSKSKDREYKTWFKEFLRDEQKLNDDIVNSRHLFNKLAQS